MGYLIGNSKKPCFCCKERPRYLSLSYCKECQDRKRLEYYAEHAKPKRALRLRLREEKNARIVPLDNGEKKERACLRCGRKFVTVPAIRICPKCKGRPVISMI